jgi:hypothetical protein
MKLFSPLLSHLVFSYRWDLKGQQGTLKTSVDVRSLQASARQYEMSIIVERKTLFPKWQRNVSMSRRSRCIISNNTDFLVDLGSPPSSSPETGTRQLPVEIGTSSQVTEHRQRYRGVLRHSILEAA